MDKKIKEGWLEVWKKNTIPFHREEFHPSLESHFNKLELKPGACVFVPLCGKSLDLIWLSKHNFKVIGVELSEIAVKSFLKKTKLNTKKNKQALLLLLSI